MQRSNFSSKAIIKIIAEVDFFANVVEQNSVFALEIPSAVFWSDFGNVILFN